MLSLTERFEIIKFLHFFAKWSLFPVQVDIELWELRALTRWRTLTCFISYGLFVANTGYKFVRLLYVLLFLRNTPLHQVMIHGIVVVGFLIVTFWYYVIFVKHADVHAKLFSMTMTGKIGEG